MLKKKSAEKNRRRFFAIGLRRKSPRRRPNFKPPDLTYFHFAAANQIRAVIESRRADLDSMYTLVMGRPEIDPVLLLGVALLQVLERLPDRQAVERCLFDVRWRLALGIPDDWQCIHPSTLSYFRDRLLKHGRGRLVMDAGLEAMNKAGYLGKRQAVRIDSTHVLAEISTMSRLECVRETLRLALDFLLEWGGPAAWEPFGLEQNEVLFPWRCSW